MATGMEDGARRMTMGGESGPTYALSYLVTAVDAGKVTAHRLFIYDEATRTFVEAPFEVTEA